jgi:hypothetical protein
MKRRWADEQNIDLRRLREVHLLLDELRNRLKQLNIFVSRDSQSRTNPTTSQSFPRTTKSSQSQSSFVFPPAESFSLFLAGAFYPDYYIREPIDLEAIDLELS